jgi:phosphate transport system permease protein
MFFAIPIGVACAVYLSEIAPDRIRRILKPAIELLSSIPSIIYGFIAFTTFVKLIQLIGHRLQVYIAQAETFFWPRILQFFAVKTGQSAFAGGIILAIMVLPTIISISDDAIKTVPRRLKEGSFALGATHWQTTWRTTLPAAVSGITAAIILAFGRAIGETMAVYMVCGGATNIPEPFYNFFKPVDTLTTIITRELPEAAWGGQTYHALFGVAIILFLITFVVNVIGDSLTKRFARRLKGE